MRTETMRTTNKLERIALQSKFNDEQIDALLEIANATENPKIAIEMLLGVYEQPYIANYVEHPDKGALTFKQYDKFKDKVYYTYARKKQVGIYVDKTVDQSLINADNYKEYEKHYNRDGVIHILITLDEWESVNESCYYETWIKYTEILL